MLACAKKNASVQTSNMCLLECMNATGAFEMKRGRRKLGKCVRVPSWPFCFLSYWSTDALVILVSSCHLVTIMVTSMECASLIHHVVQLSMWMDYLNPSHGSTDVEPGALVALDCSYPCLKLLGVLAKQAACRKGDAPGRAHRCLL